MKYRSFTSSLSKIMFYNFDRNLRFLFLIIILKYFQINSVESFQKKQCSDFCNKCVFFEIIIIHLINLFVTNMMMFYFSVDNNNASMKSNVIEWKNIDDEFMNWESSQKLCFFVCKTKHSRQWRIYGLKGHIRFLIYQVFDIISKQRVKSKWFLLWTILNTSWIQFVNMHKRRKSINASEW